VVCSHAVSKRTGIRGVALVLVLVMVAGGGFWWWRGRGGKQSPGSRGGGSEGEVIGEGKGTGKGTGKGEREMARIEGRVTGPGGGGVPAIVHLDPGDDEATTIVAGADGTFVVEDLEPGEYALSAASPGYVPDV
jgi:hypothetical protein